MQEVYNYVINQNCLHGTIIRNIFENFKLKMIFFLFIQ